MSFATDEHGRRRIGKEECWSVLSVEVCGSTLFVVLVEHQTTPMRMLFSVRLRSPVFVPECVRREQQLGGGDRWQYSCRSIQCWSLVQTAPRTTCAVMVKNETTGRGWAGWSLNRRTRVSRS